MHVINRTHAVLFSVVCNAYLLETFGELIIPSSVTMSFGIKKLVNPFKVSAQMAR